MYIYSFLDRSFYEADIFVPYWSLLQLHNSHVTSIISPRQTASVIAFSASSFGGHVHASYPNGGHWCKLVDGRPCWNVVTIKPFVKKRSTYIIYMKNSVRPIRMKLPTPRLLQTMAAIGLWIPNRPNFCWSLHLVSGYFVVVVISLSLA